MKHKYQIVLIIILSILLGIIRFSMIDDPEFTIIKKEKVIQELTTFSLPENIKFSTAIILASTI